MGDLTISPFSGEISSPWIQDPATDVFHKHYPALAEMSLRCHELTRSVFQVIFEIYTIYIKCQGILECFAQVHLYIALDLQELLQIH